MPINMSSMRKQASTKITEAPKRDGTAFWLSDGDGDLVRAIAAAEDRTIQAVLRRALKAYAGTSAEYKTAQNRARAAQQEATDA